MMVYFVEVMWFARSTNATIADVCDCRCGCVVCRLDQLLAALLIGRLTNWLISCRSSDVRRSHLRIDY